MNHNLSSLGNFWPTHLQGCGPAPFPGLEEPQAQSFEESDILGVLKDEIDISLVKRQARVAQSKGPAYTRDRDKGHKHLGNFLRVPRWDTGGSDGEGDWAGGPGWIQAWEAKESLLL